MAYKRIYYGKVTDAAGPVNNPSAYLTNRPQTEETSRNISIKDERHLVFHTLS